MRDTETAIIERIKTDVKWEEWKEQVNSQITSGLTVKEWCRQNKVNEKTYYYHLRKIRKEICEQIPVPVMTVPEESHSVKISIGDMIAEIPEGISEQMMTSLIRAMRNA